MNAPAFLFIKYSSVNVVKLCTYEIFFCHKTFKIFLLSSSNGDLKRFFFLAQRHQTSYQSIATNKNS